MMVQQELCMFEHVADGKITPFLLQMTATKKTVIKNFFSIL